MFGLSAVEKLEAKMKDSLLIMTASSLFSYTLLEDLLLFHAETIEHLEALALNEITKDEYLAWAKEFEVRVLEHRKNMLAQAKEMKAMIQNTPTAPAKAKKKFQVPVR